MEGATATERSVVLVEPQGAYMEPQGMHESDGQTALGLRG